MSSFTIIIIVVVIIVLIFIIITSITGKKSQKIEQEKRKKVVRDEIKNYIYLNENRKNIRIEYENVIARKGGDYKYRDVFDVVISLFEPKKNTLIDTRSYEIEGLTQKVDKKNYQTVWQVNSRTDLEETRRKISIATKQIKLTKEEKKAIKQEEKAAAIEERKKEREELKLIKKAQKNPSLDVGIDTEKLKKVDEVVKKTAVKFIPKRDK
ncbi:hypothetical protein [Spiroplasma endosymbiont of Aspidapion aeneum]|uniref:hypothetical protein n=1 Tax=Spiroplasma endosymbiont of Aspidapion aeneum TaxID=3066276 RepID=UPI00313B22DB